MFLGDETADIGSLSAAGAIVGLGTDSSLDNNSLSIFSEMKMAALAQKTRMRNPEAISSSQLIEMGTTNGGAISEWSVGKLAKTYAADFIVIDRSDLSLTPDDRLASHMVYSMNSRAIRDVFVNGTAVVKNGRLSRIEEEKLVREARRVTRPFFCEGVS